MEQDFLHYIICRSADETVIYIENNKISRQTVILRVQQSCWKQDKLSKCGSKSLYQQLEYIIQCKIPFTTATETTKDLSVYGEKCKIPHKDRRQSEYLKRRSFPETI